MTLEIRSINRINSDSENKQAGNFTNKSTETHNSYNLDRIDKSKLIAITLKLRKEKILDPNETLDQWLSEMMPLIVDGKNLTVPELLAGLRQFLKLRSVKY